MNKKYTTPEIKVIEINTDDIIQTSGIGIIEEAVPKTFEGAELITEESISVFNN